MERVRTGIAAKFAVLILALAAVACAQTETPAPPPPPTSDSALMKAVDIAAPATFVIAEVARSATAYTFTGPITGRVYHVSAKQEVAITGAVIGVALVVRHIWPRTRKVVDGALAVTAGAFAGAAYANAQQH